jgi:hypothetical protein
LWSRSARGCKPRIPGFLSPSSATTLGAIPNDRSILIGHDINANVGTNNREGRIHNGTLGPHGIENRNKKDTSLLNLMASLELKLTNSFFQKRTSSSSTHTHTTWKNPSASKSQHMLDIFSCSNNLFKRVRTCHTIKNGVESNHTAVIIELELTSIAFKMYAQNRPKQETTNWELILLDKKINIEYNRTLTQYTQPNPEDPQPIDYTEFFKYVKNAGEATATKTQLDPLDWFEHSKDLIQPTIDAVTDLLKQWRECHDEQTQKKDPPPSNQLPLGVELM